MPSSSSGTSVRGSNTSTLIPCCCSSSATVSALGTMAPMATMVTSLPARFTAPCRAGTTKSPSGTSPWVKPRRPCSNTSTGLSSRMAALSRPFMSAGARRNGDLQPGRRQELRVDHLGMLRRRRAHGAVDAAEGERQARLAAGHVAQLGGLVADLIPAAIEEAGELDLDHRPHARHRGADAGAGEAGLRDRRVAHARRSESVDQSARGPKAPSFTSSPMMNTLGSRSISSARASLMASMNPIAAHDRFPSDLASLCYVPDSANTSSSASAGSGQRARLREGDRLVELLLHLGGDAVELGLAR